MALCPECHRSFRTMEDEPPDECPHCGYTPWQDDDDYDAYDEDDNFNDDDWGV